MDERQAKELITQVTEIRWSLKEAGWYRLLSVGALLLIAAGVLILAFRGLR